MLRFATQERTYHCLVEACLQLRCMTGTVTIPSPASSGAADDQPIASINQQTPPKTSTRQWQFTATCYCLQTSLKRDYPSAQRRAVRNTCRMTHHQGASVQTACSIVHLTTAHPSAAASTSPHTCGFNMTTSRFIPEDALADSLVGPEQSL